MFGLPPMHQITHPIMNEGMGIRTLAVPYSFSSFELFLEAARRRKTHSTCMWSGSKHTNTHIDQQLAPATLYSVSHDLSAPFGEEGKQTRARSYGWDRQDQYRIHRV